MSQKAFNETFKEQQKTLVRSTFKKGFIIAVNSSQRTVDVSLAENPQSVLRSIPIADNLLIGNVVSSVGHKCRIDVFDETNPNDMVMAYTF